MKRTFLALSLASAMPAMVLACGSFSGSSVATGDGVPSGQPDASDAAQDQTSDAARPDTGATPRIPVCEAGSTELWREDFEKLLGIKQEWAPDQAPSDGQPAEVTSNVGRNASGGLVSTITGTPGTFAVQRRTLAIEGLRAVEFWFRSDNLDGKVVLAQLLGKPAQNIQLTRNGSALVLRQENSMESWELGAYAPRSWHRVLVRLDPRPTMQNGVRVSVRVDDGVPVERELAYAAPGVRAIDLQLGSFAPEETSKTTHIYDDASFWSCNTDSTVAPGAGAGTPAQ